MGGPLAFMTDEPIATIGILTYHSRALLKGLLESMQRNRWEYPNEIEINVSTQRLRRRSKARIHTSPKGGGEAKANYHAFMEATAASSSLRKSARVN